METRKVARLKGKREIIIKMDRKVACVELKGLTAYSNHGIFLFK
jgi:hypothetical protein